MQGPTSLHQPTCNFWLLSVDLPYRGREQPAGAQTLRGAAESKAQLHHWPVRITLNRPLTLPALPSPELGGQDSSQYEG